MTFDLYGTAAASSPATKTKPTTLEALKAAEWTQLDDGRWQLQWRDHTDYGDDGCVDDNDGHFTCILDAEGPANWSYDYDHSHRGGPQVGNDLDCGAAYVEDAKIALREEMVEMVERWEQGTKEYLRNLQSDGDDE